MEKGRLDEVFRNHHRGRGKLLAPDRGRIDAKSAAAAIGRICRIRESLGNIDRPPFPPRELAGYFGSAVAYVFIVIFLVGFFTFNVSNFFEMGQADLRGFFSGIPGCSCF